MKSVKNFSIGEEIFNAITHGIGFALSVAALVVLIVFSARHGNAWHVVSFSLFGSSLVLLYAVSTLYHSLLPGKGKRVFEILDHSAIYVLIAGTYTPVTLVTLHGSWGWSFFGVIWGLAVLGIVFKAFYTGRFKLVSTLLYVAMGLLIMIAAKPLFEKMGLVSMIFLLSGGVFYIGGTVFYLVRLFKYHHAVWHIFVLLGSVCHFFTVLYLLEF